jgi:CMP/dCMP kinase
MQENWIMDEQQNAIAQMRAVTISREYGSGGGEIAARLAERLGWQLIDHEVVVQVAQSMGVSVEEAEVHDERTEGLASRIITSLQMIQPLVPVVSPVPMATDPMAYQDALQRVIEGAIATGHVVIVGRGAQVLLARRRDVFHVRIIAPLESRIAYVMQREGLDRAAAQARVQLKDRDRLRYLQSQYNVSPENAQLYDIVVNTAILDLDSAVDILVLALERKAMQLSKTTRELGPATGMPRYPQRPADFRPPESIVGQQ